MKHPFIILVSAIFLSTVRLHADEEPLIPEPLNRVLPRITRDMRVTDAVAVLTSIYPKLKCSGGAWSGQTGFIIYDLDERYSISFSAYNRPNDGVNFISNTFLDDHTRKLHIEINRNESNTSPNKKPTKTKSK